MTLTACFLLAVAAWFAYQMLQGVHGSAGENPHMYCPHCGSFDTPKRMTRGSLAVGILLLLCFVIPGLIYGAWQQNSKFDACRSCGSEGLLPADSPRARSEMQRLSVTQ